VLFRLGHSHSRNLQIRGMAVGEWSCTQAHLRQLEKLAH
jgi:hypothetical protein